MARELLRDVPPRLSGEFLSSHQVASLSAGLATLTVPPKNFPPETLIDAAERCLYGAQISGGVIKSISL